MMKRVSIVYCWECPRQKRVYTMDDDGYKIIKSATCLLTCNELDYVYYSNFRVIDEYAFPSFCPLDNYEPSNGDLTPEDLRRINATAEAIKNAKNVKDGRYG